jgi:hypothetical protein
MVDRLGQFTLAILQKIGNPEANKSPADIGSAKIAEEDAFHREEQGRAKVNLRSHGQTGDSKPVFTNICGGQLAHEHTGLTRLPPTAAMRDAKMMFLLAVNIENVPNGEWSPLAFAAFSKVKNAPRALIDAGRVVTTWKRMHPCDCGLKR